MELVTRHPLAELFEGQGCKTHYAMGVPWIEAGRISIISAPTTAPINATKEEINRLLRSSRRITAIFPISSGTGIKSCTFWVRDCEYGLHSLQRQFRQHVQRASQDCSVRALDWDTLRSKGRNCYAMGSQRRGAKPRPAASQAGWERFCEVGASISGLEPWGCFHGPELLAYLIAHSGGGVCEAFHLHRSEAALSFRAVHLLFYEFTAAMIQRPEISGVTMGREWFPPRPSLSQFKKHAGYQSEEIQLAVVLHPAVRLILGNVVTRKVLRFLRAVTLNYTARFDSLEALEAAAATRLPSQLEMNKIVLL